VGLISSFRAIAPPLEPPVLEFHWHILCNLSCNKNNKNLKYLTCLIPRELFNLLIWVYLEVRPLQLKVLESRSVSRKTLNSLHSPNVTPLDETEAPCAGDVVGLDIEFLQLQQTTPVR